MEYSLRNADSEDQTWLESLRREVYRDLFNRTWGEWDEERHRKHFLACWERGNIQIVEVSGARAGMLQIFESDDQIEIGEIQIQAAWRGQGLGTRILKDLIERARCASRDLVLSTGVRNSSALSLYKRLGFTETGRSETHVYMSFRS